MLYTALLIWINVYLRFIIIGSEVKAKVGKGRRADQSGGGRERGKIPLAVDLGPLGMKFFKSGKEWILMLGARL